MTRAVYLKARTSWLSQSEFSKRLRCSTIEMIDFLLGQQVSERTLQILATLWI